MKRSGPPMRELMIGSLLQVILIVLLIGQLSAPVLAQTKTQADLSGKNVLILHSHEGNIPVFFGTDKGLSDTLLSAGIPGVNQFFESLDLRRNPSPEHRKLLVQQIGMRYGHRKLDMIITMYPEALEFVVKDCRNILPAVPILALYVPPGFELPKTDRWIVGHFPKIDIIGTLKIALKLVPRAKRVYVVSGVHEVDRRVEGQARHDLKKWEGPLEFHYLSHMSLEDTLTTVSNAPHDSIVLVLAFSKDVTGKDETNPYVAQRLRRVSAAPIFGVLESMIGHGITGGSVISFERIGTKAGQLALDILGGGPTGKQVPDVLDVPCVPMFDWRELRRWKLSEAALPMGSVVINRETTLWDFKYYIVGGLILCLLEFLLIAGLARQNRRRKMAEKELWERLRFEQLVSGLSAKFLTTSSDDVDREIESALKEIINFFDGSHCLLVRGFPAEKRAVIVRAAHADDFLPTPLMGNLYDFVPWTFSKMAQGEALNFTSIKGLPAEAGGDEECYRNLGVRSLLMVPITLGGVPGYALSISSHKEERVWSEDYILRLELLGKILVNRIVRKEAEESLQQKTEELDQFFGVSQDVVHCQHRCQIPSPEPGLGKGPWFQQRGTHGEAVSRLRPS